MCRTPVCFVKSFAQDCAVLKSGAVKGFPSSMSKPPLKLKPHRSHFIHAAIRFSAISAYSALCSMPVTSSHPACSAPIISDPTPENGTLKFRKQHLRIRSTHFIPRVLIFRQTIAPAPKVNAAKPGASTRPLSSARNPDEAPLLLPIAFARGNRLSHCNGLFPATTGIPAQPAYCQTQAFQAIRLPEQLLRRCLRQATRQSASAQDEGSTTESGWLTLRQFFHQNACN